jgi:O-succinylbenzoate synthase
VIFKGPFVVFFKRPLLLKIFVITFYVLGFLMALPFSHFNDLLLFAKKRQRVKKIHWCLYALKPKRLLNAHSSSLKPCEGALLRFQFKDDEVGYGVCHPWVSLKDKPLKDQLSLLKEGIFTPLTKQAYFYAQVDAYYRSHLRKNAFEGLSQVKNHFLMPEVSLFEILKAKEEGFRVLKIKVRSKQTLLFLKKHQEELQGLKLRLDFNYAFSFNVLKEALEEVQDLLPLVDWLEDPCPWRASYYEALKKWPLALDFLSFHQKKILSQKGLVTHPYKPVSHFIIKPACDSVSFIEKLLTFSSYQTIVTSYMEHPLGQLQASYVASLLEQSFHLEAYHGLLTHRLFEEDAFTSRLRVLDTKLIPPLDGLGFGYDDLLKNQNWRPL